MRALANRSDDPLIQTPSLAHAPAAMPLLARPRKVEKCREIDLPRPEWLLKLSSFEIGDAFSNPRATLSTGVMQRLSGYAAIYPASQAHGLDTAGQQRWMFGEVEVRQLEAERCRLDQWWHELPDEVREDLLSFPPDSYSSVNREFIEIVDIKEVSERELIRPRMVIPKIIRGYLHYLRLSAS